MSRCDAAKVAVACLTANKAGDALALMTQLRSEGFDRDAEAWKAWLVAKYL